MGPTDLEQLIAALGQVGELVAAANKEILAGLAQREAQLEHLAERFGQQSVPASEVTGVALAEWERAILGDELASRPDLAFQRSRLVSGVLEGEAAARALAGQLLVFRSAPAERLPPLLKEIGEAYYRWQPKAQAGNSPFEESLAAWLQRTCEAAGLHNAIELVHPGERFDAARHNASSRGVEIAEVLGWVVLRDNGKVYTKAAVAVR